MNTETFVMDSPVKYDTNEWRINSLTPVGIQSNKTDYSIEGTTLSIIFDPSDIKSCKFYKEFSTLDKRVWEKSEKSIRLKFTNTITDGMFNSSITYSDDLTIPPKLLVKVSEEDALELGESGKGRFIIGLKYVKLSPTSVSCVWFIPKFRKSIPPPPPEPIVEYSFGEMAISDGEEEEVSIVEESALGLTEEE